MKTITQRELRNDNAEVIRGVEAGETYLVTKNGTPVAQLLPASAGRPSLPVSRRASRRGGWGDLRTHRVGVPSTTDLEDLREDRV